jgi:hypothetical protein
MVVTFSSVFGRSEFHAEQLAMTPQMSAAFFTSPVRRGSWFKRRLSSALPARAGEGAHPSPSGGLRAILRVPVWCVIASEAKQSIA